MCLRTGFGYRRCGKFDESKRIKASRSISPASHYRARSPVRTLIKINVGLKHGPILAV